ncbi:MAG: Zn-dependent hydrolase, partial [Gammaproteobacteria bacterium]
MKTRSTIFIAILTWSLLAMAQTAEISADPNRMEQRIKALSAFGMDASGATSRVAFSEADLAGRKYIMGLMREAGLSVSVDTAGNIIGRRA